MREIVHFNILQAVSSLKSRTVNNKYVTCSVDYFLDKCNYAMFNTSSHKAYILENIMSTISYYSSNDNRDNIQDGSHVEATKDS